MIIDKMGNKKHNVKTPKKSPSGTGFQVPSPIPSLNFPSSNAPVSSVVAATNWMSSMQIQSAPRNKTEQLGNQAIIPCTDQSSLPCKKLNHLIEKIQEPINQKFVAINLAKFWTNTNCDHIAHTALLTQTLNIAKDHLCCYDLAHIFKQFSVLDMTQEDKPHLWWDHCKTINLFEKYLTLSVSDVANTVKWMREYLDDATLDELSWSHTFFHNSCESKSGSGNLFSNVASTIDRFVRKD